MEAYELLSFQGEVEIAAKFWKLVLSDSFLYVEKNRWESFVKLTRSFLAAHHLLRRVSERKQFDSKWWKENSLHAFDLDFLQQLSYVYFHVLKRKPGRSKSTIGPFVRFAWAAMRPVLGRRTPTIDSLNNKWARLRCDSTKSKRLR
jgi:hypothetical protein